MATDTLTMNRELGRLRMNIKVAYSTTSPKHNKWCVVPDVDNTHNYKLRLTCTVSTLSATFNGHGYSSIQHRTCSGTVILTTAAGCFSGSQVGLYHSRCHLKSTAERPRHASVLAIGQFMTQYIKILNQGARSEIGQKTREYETKLSGRGKI